MAGSRLYLVIALIVSVLMLDCGPAETNRPLFIERSFSDTEVVCILAAVETWNAAGRKYVGETLISYQGRFEDRNGLTIDSDLSDGAPVVYRVPDGNLYSRLTDGLPGKTGGLCLGSDVVLFVDIIRSEGDDDYCVALQAVATHELGHWLGLPDERSSENRDSIMYWARSKDGPFKLNLTVGDIRNLCVMYDCVVWP